MANLIFALTSNSAGMPNEIALSSLEQCQKAFIWQRALVTYPRAWRCIWLVLPVANVTRMYQNLNSEPAAGQNIDSFHFSFFSPRLAQKHAALLWNILAVDECTLHIILLPQAGSHFQVYLSHHWVSLYRGATYLTLSVRVSRHKNMETSNAGNPWYSLPGVSFDMVSVNTWWIIMFR